MSDSLKDARLNPEQVAYINAHGTSTPLGDKAESNAIKRVFGAYAKNGLCVSSTKSQLGHLLGASGGVEFIISILSLLNQLVPPTINIENQDPDCDLDYVPNTARSIKLAAYFTGPGLVSTNMAWCSGISRSCSVRAVA